MRALSCLATPLEPVAPRAPAAPTSQQAVCTLGLCRVDLAAASSCGSRHATNEDAHSALDAAPRVFVVADGVGGGALAPLASRELVALLHAAFATGRADAAAVCRAMLAADRAIARRIAELTDAPGAATVALAAPANALGSRWLVAWVGDCRVYRLARAAGALELLTRDETFRHLDEVPPAGGSLDDPARMVGNGATAGASVALTALARGDLLALCSDGVHKHLSDDDWTRVLGAPLPLAERCDALIALARAHGGSDDATVLLLRRAGFALPRRARVRNPRATS